MQAHFPPVRCRDLSPVSRRQQENLKLYSSVEGCPVLASTLIYSGFLSGTKCKNAISISGKLGFLVELSPPPSRTCVCRNLRDFENQGTAPTVSRQLLPTITSGQRHIQLPTRRVLKHGTRRNAHLWVLGTRPFASIIGTLFFFYLRQEILKRDSFVEGCPVLAGTLIYSCFLPGTKYKNAICIYVLSRIFSSNFRLTHSDMRREEFTRFRKRSRLVSNMFNSPSDVFWNTERG